MNSSYDDNLSRFGIDLFTLEWASYTRVLNITTFFHIFLRWLNPQFIVVKFAVCLGSFLVQNYYFFDLSLRAGDAVNSLQQCDVFRISLTAQNPWFARAVWWSRKLSPILCGELHDFASSMADPGFPGRRGGLPSIEGLHQPIVWQNFGRKLHENERILTAGVHP